MDERTEKHGSGQSWSGPLLMSQGLMNLALLALGAELNAQAAQCFRQAATCCDICATRLEEPEGDQQHHAHEP